MSQNGGGWEEKPEGLPESSAELELARARGLLLCRIPEGQPTLDRLRTGVIECDATVASEGTDTPCCRSPVSRLSWSKDDEEADLLYLPPDSSATTASCVAPAAAPLRGRHHRGGTRAHPCPGWEQLPSFRGRSCLSGGRGRAVVGQREDGACLFLETMVSAGSTQSGEEAKPFACRPTLHPAAGGWRGARKPALRLPAVVANEGGLPSIARISRRWQRMPFRKRAPAGPAPSERGSCSNGAN